MAARNRYYINDRSKGQDMGLANFRPGFNERYAIIDRETGKEVDEAITQYEARQAASALNAEDRAARA